MLHQRTLQAKHDVHQAHAAYQHKQHLIAKAKDAYKNRLVAQHNDSSVVTDPDSPAFDLEKFLTKLEAEN